jgi:hypothetical protein
MTANPLQANLDSLTQAAFALSGGVIGQKSQASWNVYAKAYKQLDACWNKIKTIFSLIGGYNNVISAIFKNLWNQVMSMLSQLCTTVLNVVNQISQYVQRELQSLTCIPMPKLGMKLNQINLGVSMPPPCQGVPLLGVPNTGAHQWLNTKGLIPSSQNIQKGVGW